MPDPKENLEKFITGIDNYIEGHHLNPPKFNDEFLVAENLTLAELNTLTKDDLSNYGYMLYQYADHINSELAHSRIVVNWCDKALNEIVAREYENTSQFAKNEVKVAQVLQNNQVAQKISDWRLTAQSRLESLTSKEYNVRRKADCLIEKGKRK